MHAELTAEHDDESSNTAGSIAVDDATMQSGNAITNINLLEESVRVSGRSAVQSDVYYYSSCGKYS